MTLFQAHKQITSDGTEFWMPVGPAFFDRAEAVEYFEAIYNEPGYELRETAPLSL